MIAGELPERWFRTGTTSRSSTTTGLERQANRGTPNGAHVAGGRGRGSAAAVRAVGGSGRRTHGRLHGARPHGLGRIRAPLVEATSRRDGARQGHRRRRRRRRNDRVLEGARRARGSQSISSGWVEPKRLRVHTTSARL